jgi:hypothetical protein
VKNILGINLAAARNLLYPDMNARFRQLSRKFPAFGNAVLAEIHENIGGRLRRHGIVYFMKIMSLDLPAFDGKYGITKRCLILKVIQYN